MSSDADVLAPGLRGIETFARAGFFLTLLIVIIVAGSYFGETDYSFGKIVRLICISLVSGLAAAVVGGMLGFIFGIPKALQRLPTASDKPEIVEKLKLFGEKQLFSTNTSLEEISDWLTKIIVGLSLVQFNSVIHYLFSAATVAASFVNRNDVWRKIVLPANGVATVDRDGLAAFLFAIIVIGLLGGCFFVYVQMRTRVTRLLLKAQKDILGEEAPDLPILIQSGDQIARPDPETGQPKMADLTPGDQSMLAVGWERLDTALQFGSWATAQAKIRNFQAAEDALREALKRAPSDVALLQRLAELRMVRENDQGFVETINELADKEPNPSKELLRLVKRAQLIALYLTNRDSVDKAINISNYLIKHEKPPRAISYVRQACAYGQKFKLLGQDSEARDTVRKQALDAVRQVVALCPDPASRERIQLQKLLDPDRMGSDPTENDLEVFKTDPEFQEIIMGGVY